MAFLQHAESSLAIHLRAHEEPKPKLIQARTMTDRMHAVPTILCIGNESSLLETRRLVLASAAYQVFSLPSHGKIADIKTRRIDLAIICHTVDGDETGRIVSVLRKFQPHLPVLKLTLDGEGSAGLCNQVLVSMRGPDALLRKVQQMLDGPTNPD
jgi:hypothetical protein